MWGQRAQVESEILRVDVMHLPEGIGEQAESVRTVGMRPVVPIGRMNDGNHIDC